MAKNLIDEITSTEEKAESIIKDAQSTAAQIIEDAHSQAAKMIQFSSDEAKTKGNSLIATAENNAYKARLKAEEEIDKEVEFVKQQAVDKIDDAVNLIIKEIIPQ